MDAHLSGNGVVLPPGNIIGGRLDNGVMDDPFVEVPVYQRDAAGAFPKLHRVAIGKILGEFKRCFIVRAINLCPANNVALLAQLVDPIIGHERPTAQLGRCAEGLIAHWSFIGADHDVV
jgi:hypothetical protein